MSVVGRRRPTPLSGGAQVLTPDTPVGPVTLLIGRIVHSPRHRPLLPARYNDMGGRIVKDSVPWGNWYGEVQDTDLRT